MQRFYNPVCRRWQGVDVLFLGDSIFESLRGTALGTPINRCTGVPEVLHAQMEMSYAVQVLAVACERSAFCYAAPHTRCIIMHGDALDLVAH